MSVLPPDYDCDPGGAGGGLHEDAAALLAAHGYVVLALAYYAMPGLPQTLTGIPLEYFGTALAYLGDRADTAPGQIAVHGVSKGGEAAPLTGSIYPEIRAVVSIVGGGLVTQGISQDVQTGSLLEILRTPAANWTYQGRELPYLPNVVTPRMEAAIAVERIAGPVLLISGALTLARHFREDRYVICARSPSLNHPSQGAGSAVTVESIRRCTTPCTKASGLASDPGRAG